MKRKQFTKKHMKRKQSFKRNIRRKTKKMVGGNINFRQGGWSIDDVRRTFKNTEANHDLYYWPQRKKVMISHDVNKSPAFNSVVLDSDQGIDGSTGKTGVLLDDDNIVEQITGRTKDDWSRFAENQHLIVNNMYTKVYNPASPVNVHVCKTIHPYNLNLFQAIMNDALPAGWEEKATASGKVYYIDHNTKTTQWRPPPKIPKEDIDLFFVVDVGSDLLSNLKSQIHPSFKFHFNVMHSVFTLADSARKKKPTDISFYQKRGFHKTMLYSWHDLYQYEVYPQKSLLKSNYGITSTKNPGNWNIQQNWSNPRSSESYFTSNAKVSNNKTTVFGELDKVFGSSNSNLSKLTLPIERKRSGDYLQIEYAQRFPRRLSKILRSKTAQGHLDKDVFNKNFEILFGGDSTNHAERRNAFIKRFYFKQYMEAKEKGFYSKLEDFIKKRTYFVTIDWPALCYCIFNKINVLFLNRSLKYSISFTF